MGTEKPDISSIPFANTPPFSYEWNEISSTSKLSSLTHSQPDSLYSNYSLSLGYLAPESFTSPNTHPYLSFPGGGNAHTVPVDYAYVSGQDNSRRSTVLLDTRKWSPPPNFVSPYATSKSPFPFMGLGSDTSLCLSDDGPNGFKEAFSPGHMLPTDMAPKQQAIQHNQLLSDLSLGSISSTMYHHANPGTDLDYSSFHTTDVLVPSSSPTEGVTNFASNLNEMRPPVVIYRPPDKKSSGRRLSQRACAINVEGLWIDKDDLYSGPGRVGNMIIVHECQWDMSSNPCGMWITGSRSRVGAHIRKWHAKQRHADTTRKCLWEECAKTMLRDSLNRHVVTVHLGEGFHCQSCHQEFSRKDVYNQHVEDGETCSDAVAAMVYGTECRVIDTHQALHRGGAVH